MTTHLLPLTEIIFGFNMGHKIGVTSQYKGVSMKIWYQSASSYRYESVFDDYGKTLEEQCKRALRTDTEIYVTGVPVMMREEDRYKIIRYYHVSQVFNNMLRAEREGYDAFIIGNTLEFGLDEGRGLVSIPVLGISQASYFLAAMLGELFAIVTTQDYFCEQYRQQVAKYGLSSKYLQGNYYFTISEDELAMSVKDPMPVAEKFKAEAKKAVADGASVIIPAPGLLPPLLYKVGLTNVDGATVIDSIGAVAKFAEMLVDFRKIGIEFSRRLGVYALPGKELLKEILDNYSKVFKIEY